MTLDQTHQQFWEERYRAMSKPPSGRPTAKLVELLPPLPPGRSLDLGCSRGDDVLWLASRGWEALGVDISATALDVARDRAQSLGLAERARFEQHDLAESFPRGRFDLVTALFFQSPIAFPRDKVLQQATAAVADGGYFLLLEHSVPDPASHGGTTPFNTVEQTLASLQLDASWESVRVEAHERAPEQQGKSGHVLDNVILLRKREDVAP
ncbi:class I SAM-dependent methyltransferase [Devosia submarina]|uniref:class I SAM-dependent methyltransferase n=1 Tax=Devosia submarina TaxID=1173082 RepID=UPI000D33ED67|nr:class I SAM-dependent methyltransferase [Devosia submarina]